MANKPEIQYVGQFYVYGSEAKELKKEQKKANTKLPLHHFERVQKIHVDALALVSLLTAGVLLVAMVMGALSLQTAWQELDVARQYVYELEDTNRVLTAEYRSSYNLEEIRSAAIALGMVPVEQVQVKPFTVTMPVENPEPTWMENILWFLNGLFA